MKKIQNLIDESKQILLNLFDQFIFDILTEKNSPPKFITINDYENIIETYNEKINILLKDLGINLLILYYDNVLTNLFKEEYAKKGISLRIHEYKQKCLITRVGKIVFSRKILKPDTIEGLKKLKHEENKSTIAPFDIMFSIDNLPFKVSPSLMVKIAYWGIVARSYEEAEKIILSEFKIRINSNTVRKLVNFIGELVFMYDTENANEAFNNLKNGIFNFKFDRDGILYLEIDGSFLNTRIKDINDSTWREIKLAIAFNSNDCKLYRDSKNEIRARIGHREYISIIGNVKEFKKYVFYLALQNGYGKYKKMVVISDGAVWIQSMVKALFPNAILILDLYHLLKNTHEFAEEIFNHDKKKVNEYFLKWKNLLKDGKYEDVLLEISDYKDQKMPNGVINLYHYIINNKDYINYKLYKENGYFVGSGAIESSHKFVIQLRMKGGGKKWNPKNIQNVITLRTKLFSDQWYIVKEIVEKFFIKK